MTDESIADRIERLAADEHELRIREQLERSDDDALAADRSRLGEVEVELDGCWALLRQRRALRTAGADPEATVTRDPVEGYSNTGERLRD